MNRWLSKGCGLSNNRDLESNDMSKNEEGKLIIDIPGRKQLILSHLLLDFTGTLSYGGSLIYGVAERLEELSKKLKIVVLTADTFGTVRQELDGLPLRLELISTGEDKANYVKKLGSENVVAIGNGFNDIDMVKLAALGIAVIGGEGASGKLIQAADVVVNHINDALDLLIYPIRLKATLRK